ncbi:MAG: DMT family transporter [Candidatus Cloacimonetes bacterium]|nr:DMT family transporter [Candidatus Cloacimonadota bacterium]
MKNMLIYGQATLAMLFWSLTFVWIKVALQWYRPMEIVFLRLLLASVLLLIIMLLIRHRRMPTGKDMLRLLVVAFFEPFLYFVGEANGMQYVTPTLGSLIISTIPLVTAVGAWLILREKITIYLIAGLVISFSGVALLSIEGGDGGNTFKGVLLMLLAVFAGMFYGITVRDLTHRHSALTIVAWQSIYGMVFFLPIFLINHASTFFVMEHSATGLITIAAMSLFASIGAFMLYTGVIRSLGIIRANIFTNLIPVFTAILAYLWLSETFTPRTLTGLSLAVGGLFLSQYRDLRRYLCSGG